MRGPFHGLLVSAMVFQCCCWEPFLDCCPSLLDFASGDVKLLPLCFICPFICLHSLRMGTSSTRSRLLLETFLFSCICMTHVEVFEHLARFKGPAFHLVVPGDWTQVAKCASKALTYWATSLSVFLFLQTNSFAHWGLLWLRGNLRTAVVCSTVRWPLVWSLSNTLPLCPHSRCIASGCT